MTSHDYLSLMLIINDHRKGDFHLFPPYFPSNFPKLPRFSLRHVKLPITSRDITVLQGDLTRCALDAQAIMAWSKGWFNRCVLGYRLGYII